MSLVVTIDDNSIRHYFDKIISILLFKNISENIRRIPFNYILSCLKESIKEDKFKQYLLSLDINTILTITINVIFFYEKEGSIPSEILSVLEEFFELNWDNNDIDFATVFSKTQEEEDGVTLDGEKFPTIDYFTKNSLFRRLKDAYLEDEECFTEERKDIKRNRPEQDAFLTRN